MNVKRKGSAGERELARILREYGYNARRGIQTPNGQAEADVVGVPGLHIEVKRREDTKVFSECMKQSVRDAKRLDDGTPVVAHRPNNEEWLITLRLDDFMKIIGGQDTKHELNND